jgi:hypothetical protein
VCGTLVALEIFKEMRLSFLIVGHTVKTLIKDISSFKESRHPFFEGIVKHHKRKTTTNRAFCCGRAFGIYKKLEIFYYTLFT